MNVILGMNALTLKLTELPGAARAHLEKADHSVRHLSRLIDDLLTMQEAENAGLTMHGAPFSLMEALEQISAEVSAMCQEKGLRYESSFAKCAARNYIGDAAELKRAVMCILDNAVKYTDAPGTVRFCVKCNKDRDRQPRVLFIVSDTGIGIDEAFLTRIFEPLTQEDGSATDRFGGSGMGLTVANSIIAHMGGSIQVESKKGTGSTFTVTVPIAPVPNKVCEGCQGCDPDRGEDCATCRICRLGQAMAQEDTGDAREAAPIDLAGRRVLIAEDSDDNAEILSDLLELEDVESERAGNGLTAVQMVEASEAFRYDAILMDLRMPVMDGWEAARRIRSLDRPDAKSVPIIALSANDQEQDIQRSLAAGMDAHLTKPIDADGLYAALRRWIEDREKEGKRK